jgi:hypothetical protein
MTWSQTYSRRHGVISTIDYFGYTDYFDYIIDYTELFSQLIRTRRGPTVRLSVPLYQRLFYFLRLLDKNGPKQILFLSWTWPEDRCCHHVYAPVASVCYDVSVCQTSKHTVSVNMWSALGLGCRVGCRFSSPSSHTFPHRSHTHLVHVNKREFFLLNKTIKRELNKILTYECRCNERQKDKVEGSTCLVYTEVCEWDGWVCDLDITGVPSMFKIIRSSTVLGRIFTFRFHLGEEHHTTKCSLFFMLLWIKKGRDKDKTYIWGSVRRKTQKIKLRNLHASHTLGCATPAVIHT